MAEQALQGQVALVTGGAKRIGRSIALRLAAAGAGVAVNYRRSQKEAVETVREIDRIGTRGAAYRADVAVPAEAEGLCAAVEKGFGRLDILVNNAGAFFRAPVDEMTEAQWDTILDTNLKSQFFCAQAAAKRMKARDYGRIVNIASIGGMLAWPGYTHYCVSKAGVIMLTRCLAKALAPAITVNAVAPGTIQFPGEQPDEDYIRRAPLGKVGTGEDIAEAVVFLATSTFITGQVVVVDGGRTLA